MSDKFKDNFELRFNVCDYTVDKCHQKDNYASVYNKDSEEDCYNLTTDRAFDSYKAKLLSHS